MKKAVCLIQIKGFGVAAVRVWDNKQVRLVSPGVHSVWTTGYLADLPGYPGVLAFVHKPVSKDDRRQHGVGWRVTDPVTGLCLCPEAAKTRQEALERCARYLRGMGCYG